MTGGEPAGLTGASSRRSPLSRAAIIERAVEFVDAHGLPALSMRRLGHSLGVEAMSLYHHVNGREDLLEGMVDRLVEDIRVPPGSPLGPADGWQAYLQRLAASTRSLAMRHPEVFPLVATRHPAAPWLRPPLRSLAVVEDFLEAMTGRGLTAAQAVHTYKVFTSFLLGHLLLEVAASGALARPLEQAVDGSSGQRRQRDLVTEDHPLVTRFGPLLSQHDPDSDFEHALEALLDRLDRDLRS